MDKEKNPKSELSEIFVGESRNIQLVREQIMSSAESEDHVLIMGETGTGKEIVANQIHERSKRAEKAMVKVNITALSGGLLEAELFGYKKGAFTDARSDKRGLLAAADKSSIFLDEIGDIPTYLQAKLLRAVEEKEFYPVGATEPEESKFRLIAATNQSQEKIRDDLYYRLSQIEINILPLRERREDILPLAKHFLKKERGIDLEKQYLNWITLYYLHMHVWKGNSRELQKFCKNVVTVIDMRKPTLVSREKTITEVMNRFDNDAYYLPPPVIPDPGGLWGLELLSYKEINERIQAMPSGGESYWGCGEQAILQELVSLARKILSKPRYKRLVRKYQEYRQRHKEEHKQPAVEMQSDENKSKATEVVNLLIDILQKFIGAGRDYSSLSDDRLVDLLAGKGIKLSDLTEKYIRQFLKVNPVTNKTGAKTSTRARELGIDPKTLKKYLPRKQT